MYATGTFRRSFACPRSLLVACCVLLALLLSSGTAAATNEPRFEKFLGGSVIADKPLTAVTLDAVEHGPGDTVLVGGRWRPNDGSPDVIGVMRLTPDGEYLGRLGEWSPDGGAHTYTPGTVTGIAYDARLRCIWVSGLWTGVSPPFNGAVCFDEDGRYLARIVGLNASYYPARATQDVAVDQTSGTVYLAGSWTFRTGGYLINGVACVGVNGGLSGFLYSVSMPDPAEEDGERWWAMVEARGVASAPNRRVYAGGAWLDDTGSVAWIGALGFDASGGWYSDLANEIGPGPCEAVSVSDVDADSRNHALIAALWRGSEGDVTTIGRFTTDGVFVDCLGGSLTKDGAEYRAREILSVSSDRDLPPAFDSVEDLQAIERRPLSLTVAARDVHRYLASGAWSADGVPDTVGIASLVEYGEPEALSYRLVSAPEGVTFDASARTVSWIPRPDQTGTHEIALAASDGVLETVLSIPVTVAANTPPGPPTGPVSVSGLEEEPIALELQAEDAEGDALTFEVLGGPSFGSLSGEPPQMVYTGDTDFFGDDTIVYRAFDGWDYSEPLRLTVTVENVDDPPVVVPDAGSVTVTEGEVARLTGTWYDPDPETVAIDMGAYGAATVADDGTWSWEFEPAGHQDSGRVCVRYWDECGDDVFECGFDLTVLPAPPVIESIACPVEPVAHGTPVQVSGSWSDPGTLCSHEGSVDWGDGAVTPLVVSGSGGTGTFSGSHTYGGPGVYAVSVDLCDDDGAGTEAFAGWVVVYDPAAGFVTGGGWIQSPAGAYTPADPTDPDVTGPAHFAFESAYRKGATTPTGRTSFRFTAASLSFVSETYQWLVVSGSRAQYKGSGSVNGVPGFDFMLTAIDGGTKGADRFRIKIWERDSGSLVYDNQYGLDDSGAPATTVAGGSIIVHTR